MPARWIVTFCRNAGSPRAFGADPAPMISTRLRRALIILPCLALCAATVLAQDAPPQQPAQPRPAAAEPRYLAAIRAELEALSIPAACESETATRARCAYRHRGRTSQRELSIHLVYSDETDTIYFYVDRYLVAPPGAEATTAVLRRLMELNWQMLVGKFEWDPSDGEVRLAMVMNTDSNFDRRTFRSIVRTIGPLADRYHSELAQLAAPAHEAEVPEGEPEGE